MANKTFNFGKHAISFDFQWNGITLIGVGMSANSGDDDLRFAFQVWPIGLFVGFYSPVLGDLYKKLKIEPANYGRNIGIGISKGGVLNVDFFGFKKENGRNVTKPLLYLELAEMLGQEVYEEQDRDKGEMEIEMPEGVYKAEYRAFTSFWKRKFGFTSKMGRISIKMMEEIPMPAPAEPIRGVTMLFAEKQDLTDAKIAFVNSISHQRYKIGGKDWKVKSHGRIAAVSKSKKKK